MKPISTPCEVSTLRQQLQSKLFPNGGEQPQLLLRLGYAAPTAVCPQKVAARSDAIIMSKLRHECDT